MRDRSGRRDQGQLALRMTTECPKCDAYTLCGGASTVPCECVYARSDPSHKQCGTCALWCRERHLPGQRSYAEEYQFLTSLQGTGILSKTHWGSFLRSFQSKVEEIPIDQRLIAPWVAIELRKLLTSTTKSAARLSGVALTQSLRAKMRVSDETSLIVLLHGNDNLLERFWEMDRQPFYQQLLKHNINAIMGTTFSLYNEGRLRPASHNVMQLRRHSHVLHELSSYGLTYIPNLYLRAVKDEVELAAWLRDRTDIRQVARDLSMNKTWRAKEVELDLLARALDRTARNFNVLVTGVSIGTYREVVSHLHKNGHTCTVVTPDPIMKAHHGRNLASRGWKSDYPVPAES